MNFLIENRDQCMRFLQHVEGQNDVYFADDGGKITPVSRKQFNKMSKEEKKAIYNDLEAVITHFKDEDPEKYTKALNKIRILRNEIFFSLNASLGTFRKDLLKDVLGPMLDAKDLAALSETSKAMRTKIQPFLDREWAQRRAEITIGPKQWESVGFKVAEVPPLPKDIDSILKSDCPYFKGKKVFQTHELILMPKGLSINKQDRLIHHLREGNKETIFRYIWDEITEEMRNEEVKKPYWALVTTDVIPDCGGKSFEQQKELIQEGYEVPSVLDAITLVTMDKECSSEQKGYLLPRNPVTYTHCKESVNDYQLGVGVFDRSGLYLCDVNFNVEPYIGVLALRKL